MPNDNQGNSGCRTLCLWGCIFFSLVSLGSFIGTIDSLTNRFSQDALLSRFGGIFLAGFVAWLFWRFYVIQKES